MLLDTVGHDLSVLPELKLERARFLVREAVGALARGGSWPTALLTDGGGDVGQAGEACVIALRSDK